MKRVLLLCILLCGVLVGAIIQLDKVKANVSSEENIPEFYSVKNYRSPLDSRVIDGERHYFILDELQLLVFDDELNFLSKLGHTIDSSNYDIHVINDVDGNGTSDFLFAMKFDDEHQKNITREARETGHIFSAYSYETGELLWSKNIRMEELFTEQESKFLPGDYQIKGKDLVVSYGNTVERIDVNTGNTVFKEQFNNNIWSVSILNDINRDGTLDVVANKQPNHVMILDGKSGAKLKEEQVGDKVTFADGDSISPNIWSLRYNDTSYTIGVVTEFGLFYEVDLELTVLNDYRYGSSNRDRVANLDEYNEFVNQGYTDRRSYVTYKNSKLKLVNDLDGDEKDEFVIIYAPANHWYNKKIAIYYKGNKQINYKNRIKRVITNYNHRFVAVEMEESDDYSRYSVINLKEETVNSSNMNMPESWTNNEMTLNMGDSHLELYKDNELVNRTPVYNKEQYKKNKYLYRYDQYGAKRENYRYENQIGKTKQFTQYDEKMNERFKYTALDNEWIYEFNTIDQDENLIYIHTIDHTNIHHFRLYEVGKNKPLKHYTLNEMDFSSTIATIPHFDLTSTNDYLLTIVDENTHEGDSLYINKINLNTSDIEVIFEDLYVDYFYPGNVERIDIRHNFEEDTIKTFIFGRNGRIIELYMNQLMGQMSYEVFNAESYISEIEPIEDLDGDGWHDYQMSGPTDYQRSTLFLTNANKQIITSEKREVIYQTDVDYNDDGIKDFIGVMNKDNEALINIYIYDESQSELKSYWSYSVETRNMFRFDRPVAATDDDYHILYYTEDRTSGNVVLHYVDVRTNKETTKTIVNTSLTMSQFGKMIYYKDGHVFLELDNKIFVSKFELDNKVLNLKDPKLVSVINGDSIRQYDDTLIVRNSTTNSLYISNMEDLEKNVEHRRLFNNKVNIDLTDYEFELARIRLSNLWNRLETTKKEFSYVLENDENIIVIELLDEHGDMTILVYSVEQINALTKVIGILLTLTITYTGILYYTKWKRHVREGAN